MDRLEQTLKALDAFKDWSNYLLLATTAALGWTAGKDNAAFCTPWMKSAAVVSFAVSIIFAILTLALIPHIAEDIRNDSPSIYQVYWKGWWVELRLTRLCLPQHLFFLIGIVLYASGTVFRFPSSLIALSIIIATTLGLLFMLGHLPRGK